MAKRKAKKSAKKSKKKNTPGRPEIISQEKIDKIISAIRMGSYIETAAAYAGIHKDTLYRWLKKGARKQGQLYESFSDAVQKAMAESELRDLQNIDKCAMSGNWQASAWRLERKKPKQWGRKDTVKEGGDADFDSDEENLHKKLVDLIEDG